MISRRKKKKKKRLFTGVIMAVALGAAAMAAGMLWLIVFAPGETLNQANIEKILAMESPVYYSDGRRTLGVFFEEAHRQYVPFEQIPKDFIKAIVAAEDNNFFKHYGVDFSGILRAMLVNLRAGKVVQGGSTITQQTAKNLFKRKDRSIISKFKELINAFRLEYHYSKKKILEFYSNQFYVSGNGRGLGVAARYYFDKQVSDLTTLECAFIAASVKRPNYYNPFIKKTEAEVAGAKGRAKNRVAYVLKQMSGLGWLSKADYSNYLEQEIPFRQGKMYYSVNTVMDMVREALAEPEVEDALVRRGIENISTSGIRVITTIDKELQDSSEYALRKQLSRLDVQLNGYEQASMRSVYAGMSVVTGGKPGEGDFLVGRVVEIHGLPNPKIDVSFVENGPVGAFEALVDEPGIMNLLDPLIKYGRNRWSSAGSNDLPVLLNQIKKGDHIYVSVRGVDSETGKLLLDLEKYPELEGAVLAYRNGAIKAMVGGKDNRFFNRAVTAKRPPGSAMKPLVYAAALQLGWNSIDLLNNERNVFVYQGEPYFPRPDHETSFQGVSMSWAGVHSENLATVWLLYHLCDKLSPAQLREVTEFLGLARKAGESYEMYKNRVRDKYGVQIDRNALKTMAFDKALAEMEPDLIFAGKMDEYELLETFNYGAEFDKYLKENWKEIHVARNEKELAAGIINELLFRRKMLKKNFLRYRGLIYRLDELRSGRSAVAELDAPAIEAILAAPESLDEIEEALLDEVVAEAIGVDIIEDEVEAVDLYRKKNTGVYRFGVEPEGGDWEIVTHGELENQMAFLSEEEIAGFRGSVLIEGGLSVSTLVGLDEAINKEFAKLAALPEYSEQVLYNARDFKVYVALRYLTEFCREIGIESKLDPVLSFPLGSNVISILELARAYEGISTGKIVSNCMSGDCSALAIIDRIEDVDGEVLYVPRRSEKRVLAPETSLAVVDIIKNVVKYGTGRYAYKNIRLRSNDEQRDRQLKDLALHVPVLGKTGTANRFTNSTFVGIVPAVGKNNTATVDGGYVLAAYVGFDDNKPMVRKSTRITGASGALPVWTALANTIIMDEQYSRGLDIADLSFSGLTEIPLQLPQLGQINVAINTQKGWGGIAAESGIEDNSMTADIITFGENLGGESIKPTRFFFPYWKAKEN